jgi:hypothetical protein
MSGDPAEADLLTWFLAVYPILDADADIET